MKNRNRELEKEIRGFLIYQKIENGVSYKHYRNKVGLSKDMISYIVRGKKPCPLKYYSQFEEIINKQKIIDGIRNYSEFINK